MPRSLQLVKVEGAKPGKVYCPYANSPPLFLPRHDNISTTFSHCKKNKKNKCI